MIDDIEVLCHSSIRIDKEKIIYIDPYMVNRDYNEADYIFITHDHYDHFSIEDINKVRNYNTTIIIPESLYEKVLEIGFDNMHIISVKPENEYVLDNISFKTVAAYNIDKNFHPKNNNWVGYILNIDNVVYYIAGDTDITEENKRVKCDVAFVPIGGKYTMNFKEAAELVNIISPKIAVPIHYGTIVGNKKDAIQFSNLLSKDVKCSILIKN